MTTWMRKSCDALRSLMETQY